MGKRLGRKRLYQLEKVGIKDAKSAGTGMLLCTGEQSQVRTGAEMMTEIHIDLGSSTGPARSFGDFTNTNAKVIGISGAADAAARPGQIVLVDTNQHGVVSDLEFVCVETPQGGEPDIDVWIHSQVVAVSGGVAAAGTNVITAGADYVAGVSKTYSATASLGGQYITLRCGVNDPDDAAYTHGKFILRLYGYKPFADI